MPVFCYWIPAVLTNSSIVYEQPFNELTRVCLRCAFLFQKIEHYKEQSNPWDSRECLQSILEVVSLMDRPELKTNLHKALVRYQLYLRGLTQQPHVDPTKLEAVLFQLEQSLQIITQTFAINKYWWRVQY